jgi:hypothetical protein
MCQGKPFELTLEMLQEGEERCTRENPQFALFIKYGRSFKVDTTGGACREKKVTKANKTVVGKPEGNT